MDGHRFDDLARAVAGRGTRRALLRGLAGAAGLFAAWGGSARADHITHGPGDPCTDDSQCIYGDTPLTCADNGFDYDGPLNCCTYEGNSCDSDEGCCWNATCVAGYCTSATSTAGQGDPCDPSTQCVTTDVVVNCDYVAATGDTRCCADEGGGCGWDGDCCGSASCLNGACTSVASSNVVSFAGPGEPCVDSSQCVYADTPLACDYVGQTDDTRCCAYEGDGCSWDGACCGWLTCSDAGFCTS